MNDLESMTRKELETLRRDPRTTAQERAEIDFELRSRER